MNGTPLLNPGEEEIMRELDALIAKAVTSGAVPDEVSFYALFLGVPITHEILRGVSPTLMSFRLAQVLESVLQSLAAQRIQKVLDAATPQEKH